MDQTYKFKVEMTCDGCVNAVNRSLQKSLGDKLVNVDPDVATKAVTVTVRSGVSQQEVFESLKKCGKDCEIA